MEHLGETGHMSNSGDLETITITITRSQQGAGKLDMLKKHMLKKSLMEKEDDSKDVESEDVADESSDKESEDKSPDAPEDQESDSIGAKMVKGVDVGKEDDEEEDFKDKLKKLK